jgi:penicillin V acylase-like amidase (Ntn superfamily)
MGLSLLRKFVLLAISVAVFLPWRQAAASSRMFWHYSSWVEEAMLGARTMDLNKDDQPVIYVMPAGQRRTGGISDNPDAWTSKYGSVVVVFNRQRNYCDDGVNTEGLAFHFLSMAGSQYEARDCRPGVLGAIYGQYLLDNAANVADALKLMEQTQLVPEGMATSYPCHLALEDAAGKSAVVEFVGGQMKVYQNNSAVLTDEPSLDDQLANLKNYKPFGGDRPLPGDVDSKSRFVKASAFLETLDAPLMLGGSPDLISCMFSGIHAAATPFGAVMFEGDSAVSAWPTLWTSVYDLTNKMFYFSPSQVRNIFWLDMSKLKLSPGAPVLTLQADRTDLYGDVTKKLSSPALPASQLLLFAE